MKVRTLNTGEAMPAGMNTGYEQMPLQTDWVWVAEEDGTPLGVVLAAPCHGLVYIMRLCVREGVNPHTALALLRACMKDAQDRGFRGFFFHVDPTSEVDRHILVICRKVGVKPMTIPQVLLVGSVDNARRY
jgi:hypothetical protein